MIETVTVIIACYNAERTVGRAVASALAQSVPNRVIVVDDASTDGSFGLLEGLAAREPRLVVLRQPVNGGPSAARNRGLKLAGTQWVATLDADDYLLQDRLRRLVDLGERQGLDFVADDLIRTLPGQAPGDGVRHWTDERLGSAPIGLARFVRENIWANTGSRREIGYLKPLMRTAFLQRHDLFFREDMRLAEDYELYARSLALGAKWVVTDPAGYVAVSQAGSLSRSYPTSVIAPVVEADRALLRMPGLSADDRRAVGEHLLQTETDLAWRSLIDAVRLRQVPGMVGALWAPAPVVLRLLLRSARHLIGLPAIRPLPPVVRPPARETTDLGLT
jgi:succinoglycan biosynthesis protein ExoU